MVLEPQPGSGVKERVFLATHLWQEIQLFQLTKRELVGVGLFQDTDIFKIESIDLIMYKPLYWVCGEDKQTKSQDRFYWELYAVGFLSWPKKDDVKR